MSRTRPTRIPLGDEPDDVLERATLCPASPRGQGRSADPAVHDAFAVRVLDAVRMLKRGATRQEVREKHGGVVLAEAEPEVARG